MNSELDIQQLIKAAESALSKQTVGQEFMLEDVLSQTRAAYERFPEDIVIRQVASTIEKMADRSKPGTTINQADISSIYNDLVRLSGQSKFRSVLGHLLLNQQAKVTNQNEDFVRLNRIDAEASGLSDKDLANQDMVNTLRSAFDNNMDQVKAFDESCAKAGKKYVELELKSLGFKKPKVEILGGNDQTFVYASHIDTERGMVSVAIPIHLSETKQLLLPSTFVADDHLESLNSENLKSFVSKKAQNRDFSMPKATDVLHAVGIITGKRNTPNDDFEKLSGIFGDNSTSLSLNIPNLYVDRRYEEPRKDIDTTADVKMPKELAHLAKDFEDDVLEAASAFGSDVINRGKNIVSSELKSAGLVSQVKFGSETNDSIVYLATIPTSKGPVDIEVPVEIATTADNKNIPLLPKHFAYNGTVEEFVPSNIQRFATSLSTPSSNSKVYDTVFAYMTLPELKKQITAAISEDDYVSAEAALEQVGVRFSEIDYKNAIADYNFILKQKSNISKKASKPNHTCAKLISPGKGSIYGRCGHFGVPLNQVITDASGHCKLKIAEERQKLNPTEEGSANISTSKLILT